MSLITEFDAEWSLGWRSPCAAQARRRAPTRRLVCADEGAQRPFRRQPSYVAQFGDSITYSMAFWAPVGWMEPDAFLTADDGFPKRPAEKRWRDTLKGINGKGPEHGNYSGWTINNLLGAVPAVLKRENPEVALIQIGTNDTGAGGPPADFRDKLESCSGLPGRALHSHPEHHPAQARLPRRGGKDEHDHPRAGGPVQRSAGGLPCRDPAAPAGPGLGGHADLARRRAPHGRRRGRLQRGEPQHVRLRAAHLDELPGGPRGVLPHPDRPQAVHRGGRRGRPGPSGHPLRRRRRHAGVRLRGRQREREGLELGPRGPPEVPRLGRVRAAGLRHRRRPADWRSSAPRCI